MTARGGRAGAMAAAMGVIVAIVIHGIVLYYGASRVGLPVAIAGGVAAVIVVKHLGLVGRLRALLRGRTRDGDEGR